MLKWHWLEADSLKSQYLRRNNLFRLRTSIVLALIFCATSSAAQTEKPFQELPSNFPFSRMSMTLIKSLLFVRVDVLDLEVHFGLETAGRLEALVTGRDLTAPLENSIAEIATHSQDAYIRLLFLRDIGLDRFIKGARQNTRRVYEANLITRETYDEIARQLPFWYGRLRERGIRKDDLMLYRVRGEKLRTIYRGNDGKVYLDQQVRGEQRRLALLGSYFVANSDFRDNLIRSLFLSSSGQAQGRSR